MSSSTGSINSMRIILGCLDGAMSDEMSRIHELAMKLQLLHPEIQVIGPLAAGNPMEAYKLLESPFEGDVWVECAPVVDGKAAILGAGGKVIDHHFPGDPGFGGEGFPASSLGQLLAMFPELLEVTAHLPKAGGWERFGQMWYFGGNMVALREDVIIGEVDHCLSGFAAGKLTTPRDEAQEWILQRQKHLRPQIEEAMAMLVRSGLPKIRVESRVIVDLRECEVLCPKGRLGHVLVSAAILTGIAYIGWGTQGVKPEGRHIGFGGGGTGSVVGALDFRPLLASLGAVGIFGDPQRGVGGGYIPQ